MQGAKSDHQDGTDGLSCHPNVHLCNHPLVSAKMSILRDRHTDSMLFRALVSELALLLGYEATADLCISVTGTASSDYGDFSVTTLQETVAFVPILRAGLGMLDALLRLVPTAAVFHMGIFRERDTLQPVEYYNKLPGKPSNPEITCIVLDPMLATGGTAMATINALKEWGAGRVKVVTLCASRQGVDHLIAVHPDVQVFTAAIDDGLSEDGYIVPGFGDAGDRLFRTK